MMVGIIIAPGFEEIEAVTPIDVLRRANVEVVTLGVGSKKVKGSHGIELQCDFTIEEFNGNIDGIIIPGGMPGAKNIKESKKSLDLIKKVHSNNNLVAAICASPGVVLGSLDLLKNKKFTCYPGFEELVADGIFINESVVHDDNIITSRGPGTAINFSLEIVKTLINEEISNNLRKGMIV